MSSFTYNGTNGVDKIDTSDLQDQIPYVGGFDVNGFGGNDTLTVSFIGRDGADIVDGGEGDDLLSLFSTYLAPPTGANTAIFFGDVGNDLVYVPLTDKFVPSGFSVADGFIKFTIATPSTGELTEVEVYPDVERIKIGEVDYLTEDIWNGRIRAVDIAEINARTTGENVDWWYNDLDTYTKYHSPASSSPTKKGEVIKGTNDRDKLKGTNGNDTIIGKGGPDKILGRGGDDIIDSGYWEKGDKPDKIKGGSGADTFIIKEQYWAYIKDFNVFEDKLDISGLSGGLDWDIQGNKTYIWGVDGDEVARIAGAIDLSQANII